MSNARYKITEFSELLALAAAQGWTFRETGKGHVMAYPPNDTEPYLLQTESDDPHSIKNATSGMRQRGLQLTEPLEELKEKAMASPTTEVHNGLLTKKRRVIEVCEASLDGDQLREAVSQYIQRKTSIYPPATAKAQFTLSGGVQGDFTDAMLEMTWENQRDLKEGEAA